MFGGGASLAESYNLIRMFVIPKNCPRSPVETVSVGRLLSSSALHQR